MLKLLVIRIDRVGDLIQIFPALENLIKMQNIEFKLLCNKDTIPLLYNSKYLKYSIAIDKSNPEPTIEKIKKLNFDALLCFSNDGNTFRAIKPLKDIIKIRIGCANRLSVFFFYNVWLIQNRSKGKKNEAVYCIDLLTTLVNKDKLDYNIKPKLIITEEEENNFQVNIKKKFNLKNDFLLLCIGSNRSARGWTVEKYIKVLERIIHKNIQIVLSGATSYEHKYNKFIVDYFNKNENIINLTNLLDLREFCILINAAKFVIAPSTGTIHIASALNKDLIGVYVPTKSQSQVIWKPYLTTGKILSPNVHCPIKNRCIGLTCPLYDCMNMISTKYVASHVIQSFAK